MKMNRIDLFRAGGVACFLAATVCHGFGQVPADARSKAMGSLETLRQDTWAAANNPAELPAAEGVYAGLAANNHYLVEGLNNLAFTVRYDFNGNGVGMAGQISGFQPYLKQKYALSYGRKWNDRLSAGVSLIYLNLKIAGQGILFHAATFKIGLAYHIGPLLRVSFCGSNPFRLAYSSGGNFRIPSRYIVGFSYQAMDYIEIAAEAETGTDLPLMVRGGVEYEYRQKLFLRMGLMSSPFRITGGAGFSYYPLRLDISAEYHACLGFSPGISLIYHPKKHE